MPRRQPVPGLYTFRQRVLGEFSYPNRQNWEPSSLSQVEGDLLIELRDANQKLSETHEVLTKTERNFLKTHQDLSRTVEELDATREELARKERKLTELRDTLTRLHKNLLSTHWSLRLFLKNCLLRIGRVLRLRQGKRAEFSSTEVTPVNTRPGNAARHLDAECPEKAIVERYFPAEFKEPDPLVVQRLGVGTYVRDRLERAPASSAAPSSTEPSLSIVTAYYRHDAFFVPCADSVLKAVRECQASVEWIVFNDDPSMPDDRLRGLVPEELRCHTRILSDGSNNGIAHALNEAVGHAKNQWLVILDCDDLLEKDALTELRSAILALPRCRYFTSFMTDIDENGRKIRQRNEHVGGSLPNLFDAGMIAGHMIAFRRDLYADLGGFDERFSGVQDYDFALRASALEQISRIPKCLYLYRWHDKTQSTQQQERQDLLANAVRTTFLRETLGLRRRAPRSRSSLPDRPRLLSIIRTQGRRLELLKLAVASVLNQRDADCTPCVVVHGDQQALSCVNDYLQAALDEEHHAQTIVLHASDTHRQRGYPLNVGLDFLKDNHDKFDVVSFLDDDDHYLPNFADRLLRALSLTGADLAYGQTNAVRAGEEPRVQHRLKPPLALLAKNSITSNSFILRSDVICESNIFIDETIGYLEDYEFLLSLLAIGTKMVPVFETVAEYRIIGDGNAASKDNQKHYEDCCQRVAERARIVAASTSSAEFWADVLEFPFSQYGALTEADISDLKEASDIVREVEGQA